MKIEDEIKQFSFDTEYHKVVINLLLTHAQLSNKITRLLKPHKITRQQYNILRILRGNKNSAYNIGDIKKRMLEKMSDVPRIIDRLQKRELVTRVNNKRDKRVTEISITQRGIDMLNTIDPIIDKLCLSLETSISEDEVKTLNASLDKLRN